MIFQVGYYTEVAGLGARPTDVTINGHVDVYNRCLAAGQLHRPGQLLALAVEPHDQRGRAAGCRASGEFWAVSQAAPDAPGQHHRGNLTLMDYCTAGPQYASGGFIADSRTGP